MTNRFVRNLSRWVAAIVIVLTLAPPFGGIPYAAQGAGASSTQSQGDAGAGSGAGSPQKGSPPDASDPRGGFRAVVANSWWYYALVTLLFGATVLPIAWAMVASVWRGVTGSSQPELPLGLPVGTVRSFLAYTLVVYLGFYILASVLSLSDFAPPQFLTGVVATVIGFYFGSRSDSAPATPPNPPSTAAGTAVVQGLVKNAAGSGVPNAMVVLARAADPASVVAMGQADIAGAYRLEKVAAGDYSIQATLNGRASASTTLTVAEAETKTVDLTLEDARG